MKKALILAELALATVLIAFDVLIPTLVLLPIAALTMIFRKEKPADLGFVKVPHPLRMAGFVLLAVILWTGLQMSLFMPLLNRIFGQTQNLSAYANLKGNVPDLLMFLALTWTLAAFGEETVYRGYLQRRIAGLFSNEKAGLIVAVLGSSALFGLAHIEQGASSLIITFLDALFISFLKFKFKRSLWPAILAHGLSNTIGLLWFFFMGPIYGLW